jgi:hypothetical protein
MMDLKALKKLAAACRKAGIKKYTSPEFSFELTDDMPETPIKKVLSAAPLSENPQVRDEISLTDEQLLMWSIQQTEGSTGN